MFFLLCRVIALIGVIVNIIEFFLLLNVLIVCAVHSGKSVGGRQHFFLHGWIVFFFRLLLGPKVSSFQWIQKTDGRSINFFFFFLFKLINYYKSLFLLFCHAIWFHLHLWVKIMKWCIKLSYAGFKSIHFAVLKQLWDRQPVYVIIHFFLLPPCPTLILYFLPTYSVLFFFFIPTFLAGTCGGDRRTYLFLPFSASERFGMVMVVIACLDDTRLEEQEFFHGSWLGIRFTNNDVKFKLGTLWALHYRKYDKEPIEKDSHPESAVFQHCLSAWSTPSVDFWVPDQLYVPIWLHLLWSWRRQARTYWKTTITPLNNMCEIFCPNRP